MASTSPHSTRAGCSTAVTYTAAPANKPAATIVIKMGNVTLQHLVSVAWGTAHTLVKQLSTIRLYRPPAVALAFLQNNVQSGRHNEGIANPDTSNYRARTCSGSRLDAFTSCEYFHLSSSATAIMKTRDYSLPRQPSGTETQANLLRSSGRQ